MDRVLDRRRGAGEALSRLRRRVGRGPRPRRLVLAGTALAGALTLSPGLALAQNATWSGSASGNWNTNANWVPASVPTGTATFDATGLTQAVTVTADASINTMLFSAGAPTYSYTINAGVTFDILGAGIVNNSANAPNFLNNRHTEFFQFEHGRKRKYRQQQRTNFQQCELGWQCQPDQQQFDLFQQHQHGRYRHHPQQRGNHLPRFELGWKRRHHQQRRRQSDLVCRYKHCGKREYHDQRRRADAIHP